MLRNETTPDMASTAGARMTTAVLLRNSWNRTKKNCKKPSR